MFVLRVSLSLGVSAGARVSVSVHISARSYVSGIR